MLRRFEHIDHRVPVGRSSDLHPVASASLTHLTAHRADDHIGLSSGDLDQEIGGLESGPKRIESRSDITPLAPEAKPLDSALEDETANAVFGVLPDQREVPGHRLFSMHEDDRTGDDLASHQRCGTFASGA
ncbi:hypothetical protein Csp2054_06830 [Curtobacterium sp. 'Ferrero']|nr:hypothetical protein Csp2054_06830 [Curtobacterium sp. 'Ferrero']